MTVEKLKSGSYRIRQTYNGIRYSVTVPYKPTKKECIQLIAAEMDKIQTEKTRMTFETAANRYMDTRNNVLSPSTTRGYNSILKNISEKFRKKILSDITSEEIQKEVSRYSAGRSPKSVKNMSGFVITVVKFYNPNLNVKVTLPQKVKPSGHVPTDQEVKELLKAAEGTVYEIPLVLAAHGMRRSEICALTADDVTDNTIIINKAMVQDKDNQWHIKATKTEESTRTIIVPLHIAEKIKIQGYAYKGYPTSINNWLSRTQTRLGISHFTLHKLRHYYASAAHAAGIPDVYIMAGGGWKTDHVMKNVYRHAMDDKKMEFIQKTQEIIENKIF